MRGLYGLFRKFQSRTILRVATLDTAKTGKYYFPLTVKASGIKALLSTDASIDTKRLN